MDTKGKRERGEENHFLLLRIDTESGERKGDRLT